VNGETAEKLLEKSRQTTVKFLKENGGIHPV
jgi:hypothetical protein